MAHFLIALYCSFFVFSDVRADDTPYIAVGQAKTKRAVIAYAPTKLGPGDSGLAQTATTIENTVTNDLTFIDQFKFLGAGAFVENAATAGLQPTQFKMTDWTSIGVELLIKTQVSMEGGQLKLEAYLYDVTKGQALVAKKYSSAPNTAVIVGHTFANDIVQALSGMPGLFLTKIAMVCDLTGKKEIYVMNFDGTDVKQITKFRSIAFAPDWSPDGSKIAFSLFARHARGIRNIDLYEFDFASGQSRLLSNRMGINSGASYSPDGHHLALTMSFLGNPEIYSMDLATQTVKRITHSMGMVVDPTWSPDGKTIAYVSSRSGKPMVYTSDVEGSGERRLTYAGQYNATPNWSKTGNKIVFAGTLDKVFDIFIMNPDGTKIERLTKGVGNNEDPYFSPDGNFIVFSSNRTGKANIYVMNIDGTFAKRLTYGLGNCVAPKWSAAPKQ